MNKIQSRLVRCLKKLINGWKNCRTAHKLCIYTSETALLFEKSIFFSNSTQCVELKLTHHALVWMMSASLEDAIPIKFQCLENVLFFFSSIENVTSLKCLKKHFAIRLEFGSFTLCWVWIAWGNTFDIYTRIRGNINSTHSNRDNFSHVLYVTDRKRI